MPRDAIHRTLNGEREHRQHLPRPTTIILQVSSNGGLCGLSVQPISQQLSSTPLPRRMIGLMRPVRANT